jgi:integrase
VKTGKARRIPILDTLLPFLLGLGLRCDGAVLVFPGATKGKPRRKPGVWFPFKQAVLRAGLSKGLRFHDLRRTFASHWVLDGGEIFRLPTFLGHSNVTVTQKVYAHLMPRRGNRTTTAFRSCCLRAVRCTRSPSGNCARCSALR